MDISEKGNNVVNLVRDMGSLSKFNFHLLNGGSWITCKISELIVIPLNPLGCEKDVKIINQLIVPD